MSNIQDKELRKLLGVEEIIETIHGRKHKALWCGTCSKPLGQLMEIRSMAFRALQKTKAIAEYLNLEFEDVVYDKKLHRGNFMRAKKICQLK